MRCSPCCLTTRTSRPARSGSAPTSSRGRHGWIPSDAYLPVPPPRPSWLPPSALDGAIAELLDLAAILQADALRVRADRIKGAMGVVGGDRVMSACPCRRGVRRGSLRLRAPRRRQSSGPPRHPGRRFGCSNPSMRPGILAAFRGRRHSHGGSAPLRLQDWGGATAR